MPFKKGEGGRPKGAGNKVTAAMRRKCLTLISDPAYQKDFKRRLQAGELAPALEAMAWHYAIGKPVETIQGPEGGPVPISVIHKHVHVQNP